MKLSELSNEKDRINEIDRLRAWRGDVAATVRAFDEGLVESVYTRLVGPDIDDDALDDFLPDIHPSAWPLLRQALDQTMLCIEAEMIRLGVDVDEPALAANAPSASQEDAA